MKKFTKVVLIISTCLAGIGIIFCILGFALGVSLNDFRRWVEDRGYSNFIRYDSWDDLFNRRISWNYSWDDDYYDFDEYYDEVDHEIDKKLNADYTSNESGDTIYQLKDISNMEIDIREGIVKIAEYDGAVVKVQVSKANSQFSCYANGSTLIIDDQRRGKNKPALYIYIPQDMTYEKVGINIDAADLRIDNLKANEIAIDIAAGRFSSTGTISAEQAVMSVEAGEFTSSGTILVDNATISVGAGYMKIDKFSGGNIDLNCGLGEVDLTGSLTGDNLIECGVGHITLSLDGEKKDFDYYLQSDIGSIDLNGDVYTTIGTTKHISNDSHDSLDIHVGVGSIEVDFR